MRDELSLVHLHAERDERNVDGSVKQKRKGLELYRREIERR
jgi:hypothetical protein